MPATTNPELLKTPLAKNAEKNVIPETTGETTGLFSQDLGFQEINSTPLTAGGKAPDRKDFNGVFNLLGGVAFYAQKGWTFHYDSTQDYYIGCLVIDPADGKRYECIADMPAGTVAPHADSNNDYWRRFTLGDGAHVGDIKAIAYNGEVQAGWLLCDGSAVSRTMFPDLFAAIGTTYGSGDGSTTFNVPDYNTAQRFAQGSTVAGVEKAAGLPNIEGYIDLTTGDGGTSGGSWVGRGSFAGVKTSSGGGISITTANASTYRELSFDASRSSAIYGNSTTVQPNALTTRYIIKAFDGQTADSALIDITQYAQRLEEKADINGSNMVYHRDVITTSGTYTAPVTGLYKITVKGGGGGGAGGGHSASFNFGGYGGGEGGTTIAYERIEIGDTVPVIIGGGGNGGAPSTSGVGAGGSAGGSSSVTVNGTTYTGGGGSGGGAGTIGGGGTIRGACGGTRTVVAAAVTTDGAAGGGTGGSVNDATNNTGGGGGGGTGTTTPTKGGTGGSGFVWFEYYTPGA